MKKLVNVLLILAVFILPALKIWPQTNADAAPVFSQKPSIVLDLWKNEGRNKYQDYVKLTNATLTGSISFNIYGYDSKSDNWTLIGSAGLKGYCDADTVNSPWRGKMSEFRYLAVHSLDDKKFQAQAVPYRNDIYITIFDTAIKTETNKTQSNDNAPVFDTKSSVVLDMSGKGQYNDYVKLKNVTTTQNASFNIYGYSQKSNQWVIIGPARLKKYNDTDTVSSPWRGRINEFRWLAVHSLEGISFNAQAATNRNDITIMIGDK